MANPLQSAYVHGVAISTTWADSQRSLTDLIFDTVTGALANAGARMDQMDSVVLAAHDLIDGRSLSSMVTAPAAGAYMRDEIRLAEDGLVAASLAAARIEAGESEFSVVAACGRASEGDFQRTSRTSFDPFMIQPLGLDEFSVSALRLSAWLQLNPGLDAPRRLAGAARTQRAGRNGRALGSDGYFPNLWHPLRQEEGPRMADVVVAAILGGQPSRVRVAGTGHSTDSSNVGDRDLLKMPSLAQAAQRALASATRKSTDIDIFELEGATLFDEAYALEILELAAPGQGFSTYAGSIAINASGGGSGGWCYPAMGLVRFVESYLQLTGQAGGVQVPGRLRSALATGFSPVGAQSHCAIVLERT